MLTLEHPASQPAEPPPRDRELLSKRESSIPQRAWPHRTPSSRPCSPRKPCLNRENPGSISSIQSAPSPCAAIPPEPSCTARRTRSAMRSHGSRANPFSSLASGLLRNTRRRIFHASGARHSSLNCFHGRFPWPRLPPNSRLGH